MVGGEHHEGYVTYGQWMDLLTAHRAGCWRSLGGLSANEAHLPVAAASRDSVGSLGEAKLGCATWVLQRSDKA